MLKGSGAHPAVTKLLIAPALLTRVFGTPEDGTIMFHGTGEFNFEDSNLDTYCLFDYKQTDLYWGLNREDEYYDSPRNLRKPLH